MAGKRKKDIDPVSYRERKYRQDIDHEGLISFEVQVRETDLHILADIDLRDRANFFVLQYRNQLESYGERQPNFFTSLTPLPFDPIAPPIVKEMLKAGIAADVGPMAAVAGAIAGFVGKDLLAAGAKEIIVENGGDIFMHRQKGCTVGIFAGGSPLTNRVGIKIPQQNMPIGVCTSSGTVGHSLSFGQADSVTVLASSVSLADAVATRLGNEIKQDRDIDHALGIAKSIVGILGVVIVRDQQLGAWGEVELVKLD